MARDQSHALEISRVIGDVLDPFTSSTDLRVVCVDGKIVCNGCNLRPSQVVPQPRVEIGSGDFRTFYTLVMVDADAPNPGDPYLKEYLHWMVKDIPGTTEASFGKEVVSYESPQPTIGIHRYVLVLFRQLGRGQPTINAPSQRQHFSTKDFSQLYGLGSPVAAVYYNCNRETGTGGRRFT